MKLFIGFCLAVFFSAKSFAFIPKPSTILAKVTDNAGSGVYVIEQEVSFQTAGEPIILKELWTIESYDKMKLLVTGTKELKDKLRWSFSYDGGFRNQFVAGNRQTKKLDVDFIEKYFHIRKSSDLQHVLVQSHAVPTALFNRQPFKQGKEADVVNDPNLHLARVGGAVTYAFGKLADNASESPASFFFEQDVFLLRKFRIGNMEVSADKYSTFARGLQFPRVRNVKWNENNVLIQTQQVTPRGEKTISMTLEQSTQSELSELGSVKTTIEEFYKRFR